MATANTANITSLSIAEIDALYPKPNSTLTTDLSVAPYYDDYDKTKNYYRILYRPGYAVQSRELTQSQTLLQKQISRFGQHVFKEGSIVLPGEFNIDLDVSYIKIQDSDPSTSRTVNPKSFLNTTITNEEGVTAYVIDYNDADTTNSYPKTLYVRYISGSPANTQVKSFSANNTLYSSQGQAIVVNDTDCIGKGSRFVIREGVLYAKEHFIWFPTQSIVLDRYNSKPNVRIGFQIQESVVRYTEDETLLDPALEASNYSAPGADRLKLDSILVAKSLDDVETNEDFVELFSIKEGTITEIYNRPQYNILQDEMAKRTLDESGDYYIKGLGVRIREHLNDNNNDGYLTVEEGGDANALSIGVEPGLAYVKGYERQLYVTNYLKVDKSITFGNVTLQSSTTSMGNYLLCNEFRGYVTHDQGNIVNLLDKPLRKISNTDPNYAGLGNIPGGVTTIGTAKVKHIEWYDGQLGTPNGQIAVYLTDIRMESGKAFPNVKSIYYSSSSANVVADVILNNDKAIIYDTGSDTLLYYTGSNFTRSITDPNGNPDVTYVFKRSCTSISLVSGAASFTPSLDVGESIAYGNQLSLARADKRELILTLNSGISFSTGKTPLVRTTDTTFTLTNAFNYFNVGERITFSGNTRNYLITAISGATITVSDVLPTSLLLGPVSKVYRSGDIIELTTYSSTGLEREVITSDSSITIDLKEPSLTGISCSLTYPVSINGALPSKKLLKSNCFVKIDLSSGIYASNTSGPYNLGFSDVYTIRSIRRKDGGSYPTGTSDGIDATRQFAFDNGQRDNMYDFATITPVANLFTSNTKLLVNFDYFEPSFSTGRGYFSVDSYPIDDSANYDPATDIQTAQIPQFTSQISNYTFDLRNYIDFRPLKASTATYTTSPSSASVNPAFSGGFNYGGGETALRFPAPSQQFNFSFSYYFARIDLIVMNKDGEILSIKGSPDLNPITPETPAGHMSIASIYVTPYPSLSPVYAQILRRRDLACASKNLLYIRYTMRDIGVLKERIMNLEYYASLNLLQKDATDLAVLDENGLNRFKNGIFVNDFTSHQFGDTRSEDYRIVVDVDERCIRPFFTTESIGYIFLDNDPQTNGVVITNDLITLPYTEVVLLEANNVTSARNVELSSYRFVGSVYLDPAIDVWVDTERLPPNQIYYGPTGNNIPQPVTVWNNWQKTVTGYYIPYQNIGLVSASYNPTWLAQVRNWTPQSGHPYPVYQLSNTSRTGTQTTYSITEQSISLGDRVIDTSIIPYIRPQTIDINGKGFKACTQIYVYFDGERVDQYCSPMSVYEYILSPEQRTLGYTPANTTFITSNTANAILGNTTSFNIFTPQYGAPIITDDTGEVFLMLTLPADGSKQFSVGNKEVVLTDSLTNSADATTFGKTYFYAQGLVEYKQNTILTTRNLVANVKALYESFTSNTLYGYCCTAYSFLIKAPDAEDGIFLTSVDVWYQRKDPNLGIWYEIREMDNGGNITRTQVPLSEVWLKASDIKASATFNEGAYTRVEFQAPIFLYNNKQYAFVMHTVGLNPNAYVWIARLGETDVRTGQKYATRPLTGTYFSTNNNLNWQLIPDVDMKIRFNRAKFQIGSGTAVIGNRGTDMLTYDPYAQIDANITSDLKLISPPVVTQSISPEITLKYGESFVNQQVTLRANVGFFKNGDSIMCTYTKNTYTILSVKKSSSCSSAGCDYTKVSIANGRVQCANGYFKLLYGANSFPKIDSKGQEVSYSMSKMKTVTATVKKAHGKPKPPPTGILLSQTWIQYTNTNPQWIESGLNLEVTTVTRKSNGKTITVGEVYQGQYKFKPGEYMVSSTTNTAVYITGVENYRYSVIDFEPSYLIFKNTNIEFEMKPTLNGNPGSIQSWHTIFPNRNYYYDKEMAVYSRTNEFAQFGGQRTNKVKITMATQSEYVSPVFDMARAHSIYVNNILNANTLASGNASADYSEECTFKGGPIANKYISVPITLSEGQDAEDMRVLLTSYRPPGTDVLVFAKFLNGSDSDTLAQRPWIPLEKENDTVFSNYADRNDFKEYSYYIPQEYLTGQPTDNSSGGEFQYYNSQGVLYTGYKYFQIKIALTGTNTAIPPKVGDLRCIALQI